DPDAVLARVVAFNDGDVGVADVLLDALTQVAQVLATLLEQVGEGNSADACRGPEKHLCSAVIADHLCFHVGRVDTEMLAEMNTKPLTIEIGTGTQYGGLRAGETGDVRQRIWRVGYDQQHRLWRGSHDSRHDLAIDLGIGVEQPQSTLRVAAVR